MGTERELEGGVRIVHADEWLAVVDKPAGLVVHEAPGHRGTTLVEILGPLLAGGDDPARPGIVHRLDRDTSGLMVVARTPEAHTALAAAIKERRVQREYIALIKGRPRARSGTIDAPLGRDFRAPERRAVGGRGRRAARTHFEVIEPLPQDTLVRARLETGRTHQIRAHFEAIGHPVAGDPRYGGAGRHGLGRQFLHAARLAFDHPGTGAALEFSSELPEDLRAALERARGGLGDARRP
jgi:23S rRNA pseudouridine1911/1915/1917 synthase